MSALQIAVVVGLFVGLIWAVLSATRSRLPYLEIGAAVGLLAALIWALLAASYVLAFGLTSADLTHAPEYAIAFPGAQVQEESASDLSIDLVGPTSPAAVDRLYRVSASPAEVIAFYRRELDLRGWLVVMAEFPPGDDRFDACARGLHMWVSAGGLPSHYRVSLTTLTRAVPIGVNARCYEGTPPPPEAVALTAVVAFLIYITRAARLQRRARQLRGGPLRAVGGVARWGPAFAWVPYVVLDARPGPTMTPDELIVDVGLVLIVAGAMFALWAAATLGTHFDLEPEVHSGHTVVRSGPYRFVRHPVYLGLAVHLIGACVASGNLLLILGVLLAGLPLLYLRARGEEGLLRAELGPAYDAYARKVGMFVPLLGRES